MRMLVTGFEPFAGATANSSELAVRHLAAGGIDGVDLRTAVLPVEFDRSASVLLRLIDEHEPEAVVALGQAEGRSAISFERVAVNLDDARIPDNAGAAPREARILADAPDALFTTLPVRAMADAVLAAGIAAEVSLSAGTFVCNHVFFAMQHALRVRGIPSGFVHLPIAPEQAAEFPGRPVLDIDEAARGLRIALRLLTARG